MKLQNLKPEELNMLLEKITEFRKAFNLNINQYIYQGVDTPLHNALHLEEFKELALAESLEEQMDAIGDMIYVIVGRIVEGAVKTSSKVYTHFPEYKNWLEYLVTLGDNLTYPGGTLRTFELIHESNMTKTCTKDQILENVGHYSAKGIELLVEEPLSGVFVLKTAADYPEHELKKGKVMKNIHYREVDLSEVINYGCANS